MKPIVRELLTLLCVLTILVVGLERYQINPGGLALGACALWLLTIGVHVLWNAHQARSKAKAEHEAWKARRAEGIKKIEEAAERAARQARGR